MEENVLRFHPKPSVIFAPKVRSRTISKGFEEIRTIQAIHHISTLQIRGTEEQEEFNGFVTFLVWNGKSSQPVLVENKSIAC